MVIAGVAAECGDSSSANGLCEQAGGDVKVGGLLPNDALAVGLWVGIARAAAGEFGGGVGGG